MVWPQRWFFFATGEPLTTTGVYRPAPDRHGYTALDQSFTAPANFFGASRRRSALLVELISVEDRIPAGAWVTCPDQTLAGCADALDAAPAATIDNHRSWPPLCGSFVFTRERAGPRRLAGSGRTAVARRVVAAVRVNLACAG